MLVSNVGTEVDVPTSVHPFRSVENSKAALPPNGPPICMVTVSSVVVALSMLIKGAVVLATDERVIETMLVVVDL